MKDLLVGTFGKLLQIFFVVIGIILMFMGISNVVLFILGVVSFAIAGGIRYWLGHIVRVR